MKRILLMTMFLGLSCAATAQDAARFTYLDQEVARLNRQVIALTQRLDAMQYRTPRAVGSSARDAKAPASLDWVDAAKWRQIKAGMSELEVMTLLGPPTSMRERDGARVLLYALEIGSTGFLGGSVTLRDRAVVETQAPTLQ